MGLRKVLLERTRPKNLTLSRQSVSQSYEGRRTTVTVDILWNKTVHTTQPVSGGREWDPSFRPQGRCVYSSGSGSLRTCFERSHSVKTGM